jgi:hypothetical protein
MSIYGPHEPQVHYEKDGSYTIHRLRFPDRKGRFSAWYHADGSLKDAEQIVGNKTYTIMHGKLQKALVDAGARHAAKHRNRY